MFFSYSDNVGFVKFQADLLIMGIPGTNEENIFRAGVSNSGMGFSF